MKIKIFKISNVANFLTIGFWVTASLIFIFVSYQDALARLLWQKYRNPNLTLFLDRGDASLAMFIGDYYFNGVPGSAKYNPDAAQAAYQKAVLINEKILWGHYQLARIYFVKGDSAAALSEINKELEANPENLRSLYVRGLIYGYRGEMGDLALAETDFGRFTKWAPKEWAGYNDLAWILSREGKYKDAKTTILLALREARGADRNPWLWNSLGVAELNLKEYKNARKSFERAQELAVNLTLADWRSSYPGNDPQTAKGGVKQFRDAIGENLKRAEHGDN